MKNINVIKFNPINEQHDPDLDEELIPYWHVIQNVSSGEFTACGQAITEYLYNEKQGKVTCPYCLEVIKFYKELGGSAN